MKIPSNVVAACLRGFSVVYFKNSKHSPDAPPHYHITVPINDELNLLLCVITSKVTNNVWYYYRTNEKALESLVAVDRQSLPFLKKESIIECNRPILVRKNEFSKIVEDDNSFAVIKCDIPEDIKSKIIAAINNSPIVKPFIKKLLK